MKRLTAVILVVLILAVGVTAAEWNVDVTHSSVGFSVSHLVISKVRGEFKEFEGTINFDGKEIAGGSVIFTIQMQSVDTEDEKRDNHLRSEDFFDVAKYETMSFKSTSVVPGEEGSFKLVGDFTMHGVTKEATFDCKFNGSITDPWGGTRAGFSAKGTINRQDFGITWSENLDAGGLIVGNDIEITLDMEVVQKAEEG